MALCISSKKRTKKWATPPALLEMLDQQYTFSRNLDGSLFDPAPIDWDPVTHPNGLAIDWAPSTFVNPPYSNVCDWVRKASIDGAQGQPICSAGERRHRLGVVPCPRLQPARR